MRTAIPRAKAIASCFRWAYITSNEPVVFSIFCVFRTPPDVLQPAWQNRHPERSASHICRITAGLMARSRRTSALLVGRCSSELSGRKLHRTTKKVTSSDRSGAEGPAVLRTTPGKSAFRLLYRQQKLASSVILQARFSAFSQSFSTRRCCASMLW
jgi:hypothetical protein